ncbi:MAG TPA: hypothetical protein VGF16_14390 [Bryobacteraceae bacterium]|jgi:hypothetical protein
MTAVTLFAVNLTITFVHVGFGKRTFALRTFLTNGNGDFADDVGHVHPKLAQPDYDERVNFIGRRSK